MAVEHTGGMSVQSDTFHNPVFKDSFKRVFAKPGEDGHMGIASNAIFEVGSTDISQILIPQRARDTDCSQGWWYNLMLFRQNFDPGQNSEGLL